MIGNPIEEAPQIQRSDWWNLPLEEWNAPEEPWRKLDLSMSLILLPEDIAYGSRGDPHRCAIALALKRMLGRNWGANVGGGQIMIGRNLPFPLGFHAHSDQEVAEFIFRFDKGQPVYPGSFHISFERIA